MSVCITYYLFAFISIEGINRRKDSDALFVVVSHNSCVKGKMLGDKLQAIWVIAPAVCWCIPMEILWNREHYLLLHHLLSFSVFFLKIVACWYPISQIESNVCIRHIENEHWKDQWDCYDLLMSNYDDDANTHMC